MLYLLSRFYDICFYLLRYPFKGFGLRACIQENALFRKLQCKTLEKENIGRYRDRATLNGEP